MRSTVSGSPVRRSSWEQNFIHVTVTQARPGHYVLKDGVWKRLTEREQIADYSAIITTASSMPVLDSWDGVTMPIEGADKELEALSIDRVDGNSTSTAPTRYYDLGGRAVNAGKGVVVGKGKKVVKR